jgi:hypothetical protein
MARRFLSLWTAPGPFVHVVASNAVGVGHDPAPIPPVRGSGVMRSHNTPARIIPHFGKVTEDHGKSSGNKQR